MEAEQIRQLLEIFKSLGEGAQVAFGWWLLAEKIAPIFGWLITLAVLSALLRRLMRTIESHANAKRVAVAMGEMFQVDLRSHITDREVELVIIEARESLARLRELEAGARNDRG